MNEINLKKIDFLTVLAVFFLSILGLLNIYSAVHANNFESPLSLDNPFGKQFVFLIISFILFILVQALPFKFFEKFASIAYVLSMLSLFGLFIFGKNINGATAWYQIFGFGFQPSELAKPITALALAKFLSDLNANIRTIKTQFYSFLIILIPILLIILQPDPGSTLIFLSFFLVFYKIGLPSIYMNLFIGFIILFFLTILLSKKIIIITIFSISVLAIFYFFKKKKSIKKIIIYSFVFSSFVFGSMPNSFENFLLVITLSYVNAKYFIFK